MHRRSLVAAATAACFAVMTFVIAVAGAAAAAEPLTLQFSTINVGGTTGVSGSSPRCTGTQVLVSAFVAGSVESADLVGDAHTAALADGSFNVDLTLFDGTNPGSYDVYADCFSYFQVEERFGPANLRVTSQAPPPPVTTSTTAPPVPTTTAPPVPTTAPPVPTTAPLVPTRAPPNSAPSATAESPVSSTTTAGSPPPRTLPPRSTSEDLELDVVGTPFVVPGGPVRLRGTGCSARSTVTFSIDSQVIGSVVADENGLFDAVLTTPSTPIGRSQLVASCDGRNDVVVLDVVQTASERPQAQSGLILGFFVLVGGAIVHGRQQATPRKLPQIDHSEDRT